MLWVMYLFVPIRQRFWVVQYSARPAGNPKEMTGRKNGMNFMIICCWGFALALALRACSCRFCTMPVTSMIPSRARNGMAISTPIWSASLADRLRSMPRKFMSLVWLNATYMALSGFRCEGWKTWSVITHGVRPAPVID